MELERDTKVCLGCKSLHPWLFKSLFLINFLLWVFTLQWIINLIFFLYKLLVISNNETFLGECSFVFIVILYKSSPFAAYWGSLLHSAESRARSGVGLPDLGLIELSHSIYWGFQMPTIKSQWRKFMFIIVDVGRKLQLSRSTSCRGRGF